MFFPFIELTFEQCTTVKACCIHSLSFVPLRMAEPPYFRVFSVNTKWSHLHHKQVDSWLMTNILYQKIEFTH